MILSAPVGGLARFVDHRHAVLGFFRRRIPGPVRRLGADGRGLYLLCQRAAPQRHAVAEAIRQGAILRLRPIMMTALVAALGCCRRRWPPASAPIPRGRSPWSSSRLVYPARDQRLPDAGTLCAGGAPGRPAGGLTGRSRRFPSARNTGSRCEERAAIILRRVGLGAPAKARSNQ